MALLGYQVVISLIMASVIQKIGKHYSFAKWMICNTGLVRYLYPTDSELRQLAGVPKEINKKKKDKRYNENGHISSSQVFHVPRNLNLELTLYDLDSSVPGEKRWYLVLECGGVVLLSPVDRKYRLENAKVGILDVIHLRFFQDYQMLLDFALYSLIVYILTEIFSYFMPLKDEINLSMVWCVLVVLFSTKILLNLTLQYFTGEESIGERSTVIVTFFAYLLLAMVILLVNEENLETGLDEAYKSFNESANSFLERHGLNSEGPASKLILKLSIALWCALIGALFTFPGLRVARMHWDSMRDCSDNRVLGVVLNLNFAAPFFLVLLWLRPVTKHYLTVRVFSGMQGPIMTEHAFDILRILLIVVVVLLRVALMPFYLQAYLNIAERRVQEQRREAGRITNKDLQKKIAAVFYYMCVVALQYIAPILLCLYFALMYKTLGEYSWSNIFDTTGIIFEEECPLETKPPAPLGEEDSVLRSAQEITLAIGSLKQVLTKEVARGVFGFATWWVCFSWFSSSALGLIYQSYFTQV